MFNKLSLFFAAIFLCSTVVRASDGEFEEEEPYETEFIRGFEEGIQTRQFYRQIYEETGEFTVGELKQNECQLPQEASPKEKAAYEKIKSSINNARAFLNLDPKQDAAFDLILEIIAGFYKFVAILTPAYDEQPTEYCYGFALGLEGSMMLAKIANRWVNPVDSEGVAASIKDFRPRDVIKGGRKKMKEKMRGEDGIFKKIKGVAKDAIKSTLGDIK